MTDQFILDISSQMRLRFQTLLKINSITNELEKSFKSDDNALIRETLVKRAEEIEVCKSIDEAILKLTHNEKNLNSNKFINFLKGDESQEELLRDEKLKELVKIVKESKLVAKKIIEKDEKLNKHIAGKKSFYNK